MTWSSRVFQLPTGGSRPFELSNWRSSDLPRGGRGFSRPAEQRLATAGFGRSDLLVRPACGSRRFDDPVSSGLSLRRGTADGIVCGVEQPARSAEAGRSSLSGWTPCGCSAVSGEIRRRRAAGGRLSRRQHKAGDRPARKFTEESQTAGNREFAEGAREREREAGRRPRARARAHNGQPAGNARQTERTQETRAPGAVCTVQPPGKHSPLDRAQF